MDTTISPLSMPYAKVSDATIANFVGNVLSSMDEESRASSTNLSTVRCQGMGSKIVLNTFGSLGDLNPYLGIALGLKSRGHAPVIATAGVYREYVEGAGVGFHPVRPDVSIDDRETIRRVMDPKGGMEFLLRGVLLSRLQESYLDLEEALRGASLLVTHP